MMLEKVLIADDEMIMRKFLAETMRRKKVDVDLANNGLEAIKMLENDPTYDLLITDIKMPGADGVSVLKKAKELYPDMPVIIMTAYGTIENAVEAMKIGAEDYLLKPFSPDQIEMILKKLEDRRTLINENKYLRAELNKEYGFGEFIGKSPKMMQIYETINKIADSKASILIQGESGTGKELIARAIHYNSQRNNRPFIKVNCAALSETLLESELFGHEKGAFTGAITKRQGRFELAHTGTILLDEISEISTAIQVKLLRVLQEREFERVGGMKTIKIDTRVISTTNRDLKKAIADGEFREDLFFRLNVIPLFVPPLRERKEDIPLLADYFLNSFAQENHKEPIEISKAAMDVLMSHNWPGNVREFENLMERLVVMDFAKVIKPEHLPMDFCSHHNPANINTKTTSASPVSLEEMEKEMIMNTLQQMNGNRTKAAQSLGISVRTLRNKLSQYKADEPVGAL